MGIQSDYAEQHEIDAKTLHALSERYHVDESIITEIYQSKLAELQFHASITAFLPVLVERHIKNKLQFRHDS